MSQLGSIGEGVLWPARHEQQKASQSGYLLMQRASEG